MTAAGAYLAFLLGCLVVLFAGTFTAQLDTAELVPGITVGGRALGPSLSFPRVMLLRFSITGTILLLADAALLAFLGSRARLGDTTGLYPAEMVAVTLVFAGFLLAGTLDKGARMVQARRKAAAGRTGS